MRKSSVEIKKCPDWTWVWLSNCESFLVEPQCFHVWPRIPEPGTHVTTCVSWESFSLIAIVIVGYRCHGRCTEKQGFRELINHSGSASGMHIQICPSCFFENCALQKHHGKVFFLNPFMAINVACQPQNARFLMIPSGQFWKRYGNPWLIPGRKWTTFYMANCPYVHSLE